VLFLLNLFYIVLSESISAGNTVQYCANICHANKANFILLYKSSSCVVMDDSLMWRPFSQNQHDKCCNSV